VRSPGVHPRKLQRLSRIPNDHDIPDPSGAYITSAREGLRCFEIGRYDAIPPRSDPSRNSVRALRRANGDSPSKELPTARVRGSAPRRARRESPTGYAGFVGIAYGWGRSIPSMRSPSSGGASWRASIEAMSATSSSAAAGLPVRKPYNRADASRRWLVRRRRARRARRGPRDPRRVRASQAFVLNVAGGFENRPESSQTEFNPALDRTERFRKARPRSPFGSSLRNMPTRARVRCSTEVRAALGEPGRVRSGRVTVTRRVPMASMQDVAGGERCELDAVAARSPRYERRQPKSFADYRARLSTAWAHARVRANASATQSFASSALPKTL